MPTSFYKLRSLISFVTTSIYGGCVINELCFVKEVDIECQ